MSVIFVWMDSNTLIYFSSLLHWLAFWAKGKNVSAFSVAQHSHPFLGWHHSISKYKNQIYLLIQQMHRDLDDVQPDNRFSADWYLDMDCFRSIEQLLRSTKTVDENERLESDLAQLTESYVSSEEERLERNLKSVGYNIDSPATVSLITGQGRIERVGQLIHAIDVVLKDNYSTCIPYSILF